MNDRAANIDDIRLSDKFTIGHRGGKGPRRSKSTHPKDPIMESNVVISIIDRSNKVVDRRESHNLFVDYGRDWLAHFISLNTGGASFRSDHVELMAFGIGGTSQQVASSTIRSTSGYNYPGFPNDWVGGSGSGDPAQTDTDPTVTALEWPVEVEASDYYDLISQPATFPGATGVVRYTSIIGYDDISFGSYPRVPLSEIGLFTEGVSDQSVAPVIATGYPAEKFMIAYNTFDTITKTTSFVLQIDWELRFS